MKEILTDPVIVSRLKCDPTRFVISIDISGVQISKRIERINEWKQALKRFEEIEKQKTEI